MSIEVCVRCGRQWHECEPADEMKEWRVCVNCLTGLLLPAFAQEPLPKEQLPFKQADPPPPLPKIFP
jgi:hypothetical protein